MNKMASTFNEQQFENKLVNLKDSQESINSLSAWCLQNKDHHKKIVNCWLHCLKRVKIEQRLSLFYLANDVIQYSKRKHYQFVESWGTALQKATTLVRDDKVKSRIMRIFKIWDERGVYDEAFISDLCGLLTTNVKKKIEANFDSQEFQPSILIAKIQECKILEQDTDIRFRKVKENSLHMTDAESVRTHLKDRRHGPDIVAEVDAGVKKMEAYVKALELEIAEREKLIIILQQAALFYESQRGEAKIVCNAYRNFGNKVKLLKRKLDEMIPSLSDSPIPSPDANAPSPSSDSDFELPSHEKSRQAHIINNNSNSNFPENNGFDFSFVNSTFMGNSQFSDINLQRDVFNDPVHPHPIPNANHHDNLQPENAVRPIEVISTREQKEDSNFNITDFIKSLLPSGITKPEEGIDPTRSQPMEPLPQPMEPLNQSMESLPVPLPLPMPMPMPLQPPPMPPIFTTNDAFSVNWKAEWGQPDEVQVNPWNPEQGQEWNVPTQVPDPWIEQSGNVLTSDTPESPPLYEKKGISQPVEYDDSLPPPVLVDVDHRTLPPFPELRDMDHRMSVPHRIDIDHRKLKLCPKDIDHRNLISLTASPRKGKKLLPPPPSFVWSGDQDYRCKASDTDFRLDPRPGGGFSSPAQQLQPSPPSHKPTISEPVERKDVNVESIDMDVSEEDEEEPGGIIHLEEDVDDRNSYLNQSNLTNFNMSSSFIDNVGESGRSDQDVDERLKSIFGGLRQNPGAKLIPPASDSCETEQEKENGEEIQPNGFLPERNEHFRPELLWQQDGQSELPPLCPPGVSLRRMGFVSTLGRSSPRPLPRGRVLHRFPFRPHHPRMEMMRRLPFRPRMPPPVRGGRW